ncbi:hypothetical protein N9917_03450 [Deltaproteobacteria bacterium]|nr:hypothetical protein [Deltaproteobacteria bacterium]
MTLLAFMLLSACTPAVEEAPAPAPSVAEVLPETPHDALVKSLATCKADEECMTHLTATEPLLGSCPWYEAVGCSVAVGAAGTACVVTEGEACAEALELVAKIGCCDCLPSGKVQDICKAI